MYYYPYQHATKFSTFKKKVEAVLKEVTSLWQAVMCSFSDAYDWKQWGT